MKMGRKEAVAGAVICLAVALLQVGWQPKKREMDVISSIRKSRKLHEVIAICLNICYDIL